VTYNQAFQVPNYSEFFLRVLAGSADLPFFASPTNPRGTTAIRALGNSALVVEEIQGYEAGYKGIFFDKQVFVTLDGYFNKAKNFITDLLQAVNPQYPFNVPPGFPAGLIEVARQAVPGLAVVDGRPAIVVSYSNAGKVEETGVELGANYYVNDEVSLSGSWTWYDFKVVEQKSGDILLPNAPKHKFAAGFTWTRPDGIDLQINARNVQPFRWAAGVFAGDVPAYTIVNISGGWRINTNYRIGVTVNNAFDNRVFQLFGGSVIGRQAIGTLTATF
jgi:outer membrane receptor protein involved in Fe transport